ncbi:hypothetical protein MHBO_001211 [Bonamia ostreae]|uniref:Calcium-dependent protein kinase n=1 Tax=Bonamia ostreae TaxID=126728 RepID=A0ABV2AI77_9EUKA
MELCEGGELFDRILAKGSYSEKDAAFVLKQAVEGINYLHNQKIAHLDLKPDNFLFVNKDEKSKLKIIDFGMSSVVEKHKYLKKLVGTPYYVAPEVLRGQYTESCDIWSVGIIMFVLLYGYPPFYSDPNNHNSEQKIFEQIKKGFNPIVKDDYGPWFPKSVHCSDSAKNLISKLLDKDPVKRITAKEALEHSWFSTADDRMVESSVVSKIISFRNTCKLKNAFLNFMVNSLDEDEMKDLTDEFEQIDTNKNGRISFAELKSVLKRNNCEIAEEKISDIMKHMDEDNDGSISVNEWCMVAMNKRLLEKEERLMQFLSQHKKFIQKNRRKRRRKVV